MKIRLYPIKNLLFLGEMRYILNEEEGNKTQTAFLLNKSQTKSREKRGYSMRGVETRIQEIRHRIFREVARMAYHTEWPVDNGL